MCVFACAHTRPFACNARVQVANHMRRGPLPPPSSASCFATSLPAAPCKRMASDAATSDCPHQLTHCTGSTHSHTHTPHTPSHYLGRGCPRAPVYSRPRAGPIIARLKGQAFLQWGRATMSRCLAPPARLAIRRLSRHAVSPDSERARARERTSECTHRFLAGDISACWPVRTSRLSTKKIIRG